MIKKLLTFIFIAVTLVATPAHALTKLFYALRDSDTPNLQDHYRVLNEINQHANKIDIIVPQAYVISSQGLLYEIIQSEFYKTAKQHNVKVMPLVTNEDFNAKQVDHFLKNSKAQRSAINSLVRVCKKYHFYGLQIDFEHVPVQDRDAFTKFFTNTATALHAINCKISAAIVPKRYEIPPSAVLLKRDLYWSGAYDQKKLGSVSDFIVLMTYNQNGGMTTPGPNASAALDTLAIRYALKRIPHQKVFLGIPTASNYWLMSSHGPTTAPIVGHGIGISYQQVALLQKMHQLKWKWDSHAKVHYAVFPFQDFYHYLFVEDADSFAAIQQLAKQNQLGGIAVFRLGNEDPKIWNKVVLTNARE